MSKSKPSTDRDGPSRLGPFVREYVSKESLYYFPVQCGCSVVGVIGCTILFFVVESTVLRWVFGIVGVLSIMIGIGVIYDLVTGSSQVVRLRLYENGFVYQSGGTNECLWTEVAEIYDSDATSDDKETGEPPRIRLPDDTLLVFPSHLDGIKEFGPIVVSEVTSALLQRKEQALTEEGRASFGKRLKVEEGGLVVDGALVPWNKVEAVRLHTTRRMRAPSIANHPMPGGALTYFLKQWASKEKKVVKFQVLARSAEPLELDLDEITNLPILVKLLRNRFDLRVKRTSARAND